MFMNVTLCMYMIRRLYSLYLYVHDINMSVQCSDMYVTVCTILPYPQPVQVSGFQTEGSIQVGKSTPFLNLAISSDQAGICVE